MGISIGMVGLGQFGKAFAELFKSHPAVDRIALCDNEPDRIKHFADMPSFQDKFNNKDAYISLDEILKAELDALVIITQPWLHAPQCLAALEAGMHVYSAVPIMMVPDGDEILDWCDKLIGAVRKTGKYYMLGETTYYRPQAMYCRRKAREGAFGDFVYAEGEYFHDVDANCNLRLVQQRREDSTSGRAWPELQQKYSARGIKSGPMHYPTHSTSGPVCVMNAHAVKVVGYGYRNQTNDSYFEHDDFSNETALFTMSNGANVRICEFREAAGQTGIGEESFRIFGTRGSFSEDTWFQTHRTLPDPAPKPEVTKLNIEDMRDPLPSEVAGEFVKLEAHRSGEGQDAEFTPSGHGGAHPYLVHEFVDAVVNNRQPAINAWEAARYMAMGVMAHKSALRDGERLEVPDWGDAPV